MDHMMAPAMPEVPVENVPEPNAHREAVYYRMGRVLMAARLYLLLGDKISRHHLAELLNDEFGNAWEPVK